jgi:hypothetical protein
MLPEVMPLVLQELRQLEPHQAGGDCAVLVTTGTYLPPAAWEWLSAVQGQLAGCSEGAVGERAHRETQTACAPADEAVVLSDGAAAMLSRAGGARAVLTQPCTMGDVGKLFGPHEAVELDVS